MNFDSETAEIYRVRQKSSQPLVWVDFVSSAYNKTSDILLTGRLSAVWEIRGWVSKTQRQNINSSRLSSDGLKHPLRSLSRAIQTTKARPVVLVIPLLKPLPHITRQWLQCTCYTLILIIYIVLWLRLSISEIAHWRVLWFGRSSWALVLYGTNYSNKKKSWKNWSRSALFCHAVWLTKTNFA